MPLTAPSSRALGSNRRRPEMTRRRCGRGEGGSAHAAGRFPPLSVRLPGGLRGVPGGGLLQAMGRTPGGSGPARAHFGQGRVAAAPGRVSKEEGTGGLSLAAGAVRLRAAAPPVAVGCPQWAGVAVPVSLSLLVVTAVCQRSVPLDWPLSSGRACARVSAGRHHSPVAPGEGATALIGPRCR